MGQDNRDERCYGIKELAELGGVTRRTVRYYVQRGLLPTPLGTGRGPHYTSAHLERLIHIRTLQEAGVPLAEIAARLNGAPQMPGHTLEVPAERSTSLRASSTHVLPEERAALNEAALRQRRRGEGGPLNWPPSAHAVAGNSGPLHWAALPTQSQGETWMRFVLTDGVELHVRAGAASLQPWQLARLVEAAQQMLGPQTASHSSGRSMNHERNAAQLPDDTESRPDPTPGRTH
jgi:DNA-binding transcriptional MerR regulator